MSPFPVQGAFAFSLAVGCTLVGSLLEKAACLNNAKQNQKAGQPRNAHFPINTHAFSSMNLHSK